VEYRLAVTLVEYFIAVEEYDPTKPLVAPTAPAKSHTDMDVDGEEPYDPIVSAYSLADAEMLNAEDAPGMLLPTSIVLSA